MAVAAWELSSLQPLQKHSIVSDAVLRQWQEQQLLAFVHQGFPTRREEAWKYTDVAPIADRSYADRSDGLSQVSPPIDIDSYRREGTVSIVFVDGVYQPALSRWDHFPKQAVLCNLASRINTRDASLSVLLQQKIDTRFALLNAALLTDGMFLWVPRDTVIQCPIHLLYVTHRGEEALMHHPRHVIQVGENSTVTVFEEYLAIQPGAYFNNVVTQITVCSGATLDYLKLQRESRQSNHMATLVVDQAKDSQFNAFHVNMGARLSREDIAIDLGEEGAGCQLLGLTYLNAAQHNDGHSCIEHRASRTSSRQYYKGIYDKTSHGVFNGKIRVHNGAERVVANQTNENLLLSDTAQVDTKPELEIYAEDVQCSHGATVGQLDNEALFYMQSRGIDLAMAQHLLTCAFANEILHAMPENAVSQHIQQWVVQRLATMECQGECVDE